MATNGDAKQLRTSRDLAAWLGLTPLKQPGGGKKKLGKISKKGDRYIRKLLITGMTSRALMGRKHPEHIDILSASILTEKPFRLATVAMASKAARII